MKRIDDYTIIEHGINKVEDGRQFLMERIPTMSLERYRQASYEEKKNMIIRHMMTVGASVAKDFPDLLKSLRDFEKLLYATDKLYRDHTFHTFRVWGLGLYLYHNGLREFISKGERLNFHLIWYLASVYHDVGYPISKLKRLVNNLNSYFEYLTGIDVFELVKFDKTINPALNDLTTNDYLMRLFPNEGHEIYRHVLKQRHGLIGARLLLYSLRSRFGIAGRESERAFPAIIAIGEHDGFRPISFVDEPFSVLLVICDELQEWGRPYISSILGERYVSTDHIDLNVSTDGTIPVITAMIDYRKSQSDLYELLGWLGEIAEKEKQNNFKRLNGIRINVEMQYFRQ